MRTEVIARRLRVVVLSEHAAHDVLAFSGIPFHMEQALQVHVDLVAHIQVPSFDIAEMLSDPEPGREKLRSIGAWASAQLNRLEADVVLCQGSSMIPFLRTDMRIVLWHDSTWQTLMRISAAELEHWHPLLHEWDLRVLDVCDNLFFASQWVLEETMDAYGSRSAELAVLPFGASLPEMKETDVAQAIEARRPDVCKFAFVGVDWPRKGLPLAARVVVELNRRGFPSRLDVIGVDPSGTDDRSAGTFVVSAPFDSTRLEMQRLKSQSTIRFHGFLAKHARSDAERFAQILGGAHFLLHPASFECFGVALVEANAFGVPVLCIGSGGPGDIVRNGRNGWTFSADDFGDGAVDVAAHAVASDYHSFARTSREEYGQRFRWDVNCASLVAQLTRP